MLLCSRRCNRFCHVWPCWRRAWRRYFFRLRFWRGNRSRFFLRFAIAFDFEPNQFGANRDLFTDLAIDRQNLACARRWNFNCCLVGHDGGKQIILADETPHLHVPFDQFSLGNAFADIGEFD